MTVGRVHHYPPLQIQPIHLGAMLREKMVRQGETLMNTEQMNELTFLYTMVNHPIEYKSRDKAQEFAVSSRSNEDPLSWLYTALDWLYSKTLRTGRALLSA